MKKLKNYNLVAESLDSHFLQKQLDDLIDDSKRNGDRDIVKFYDYLRTRINQSYPDGDISIRDVNDILDDPRYRSMKLNVPSWLVDDLFESKQNVTSPKRLNESRRLVQIGNTLEYDIEHFLNKTIIPNSFGIARDEKGAARLLVQLLELRYKL